MSAIPGIPGVPAPPPLTLKGGDAGPSSAASKFGNVIVTGKGGIGFWGFTLGLVGLLIWLKKK